MSDTGCGAVGLRRPTPLWEARLIFSTARCMLSAQVCPSPTERSLAFSICWKAALRFATTSIPPIVLMSRGAKSYGSGRPILDASCSQVTNYTPAGPEDPGRH
jgi:hypothetical protein